MIKSIHFEGIEYCNKEYGVCTVYDESGTWHIGCLGTLGDLVLQFVKGNCPLGIVLDRMQEEPSEFGSMKTTQKGHMYIVDYLRAKYKDPFILIDEY